MPFFNKNLSSAHKKYREEEIAVSKKDLIKIKGFMLNNAVWVFLYYEKQKRHYANLNHKDIVDNK